MNFDPGDQYNLKFGGNAAAHVDAYWEYKKIVGNDDGGREFTPEEYEAYKERVKNMRINNRLYVSWMNKDGMDCKLIGPETPCFCEHRYVEHQSDYDTVPPERPVPIPCTVSGCACAMFFYSPKLGNQNPRCGCKHFPEDHNTTRRPFKCRKDNCKCPGFRTAVRCGCGQLASEHIMHVETKDERIARGRPVGQDVLYKGMGGITGFSSLMDGYMRLDDSGIGAPTQEFLDQPITSSDHPFLRAHARSLQARGATGVDEEVASATRRPGETDMEYFERRYQERLKREREGPKAIPYTGSSRAVRGTGGGGGGRGGGGGGRGQASTSQPGSSRMSITGAKPKQKK